MRRIAFALWIAAATLAGTSARPARGDDIQWRGQLELTESSRGRPLELNWLMHGDTQFDAYRFRLFAEGRAAQGIELFTQVLFDEQFGSEAYGAYAVITPYPERDLHLVAGKIPSLIGTYAPRTYADKKPLIGTPLMYFYRTTLRVGQLVPSIDALLGGAAAGWRGMPVLYDACWDFGGMITGSMRPLEFAAGFVNGTPSAATPSQDSNDSKSALGRIGFVPVPAIRVGASGAYGAYLPERLNPLLPGGTNANNFHQRLLMADAQFEAGRLELIAEGFANTWETPTVGDLDLNGYYVEGKLGLGAAAYGAARWESMRFAEVTSSTGKREPWDYDLDRLEAGLGYRIARGATLKAVFQRTAQIDEGERTNFDLYALQLALGF